MEEEVQSSSSSSKGLELLEFLMLQSDVVEVEVIVGDEEDEEQEGRNEEDDDEEVECPFSFVNFIFFIHHY